MSINRRSIGAVGVALILIITVAVIIPREAPSEVTACVAAERWLTANAENLPSTYDELAKLPVLYRKAAYSRFSLDTRVLLWQTHLNRFLAAKDLSDDQIAFVERIKLELGQQLRNGPSPQLKDLEREAKLVLGVDLARQAIANLGPAELVASEDGTFTEACSCSDGSDWCPGGFECSSDNDGCVIVRDECGTFWTHNCDGECLMDEQQ